MRQQTAYVILSWSEYNLIVLFYDLYLTYLYLQETKSLETRFVLCSVLFTHCHNNGKFRSRGNFVGIVTKRRHRLMRFPQMREFTLFHDVRHIPGITTIYT